MNHRNYVLPGLTAVLAALVFFIGAHPSMAQQKELTRRQILDRDFDEIVQPLPRLMQWTDDSHFVLGRPSEAEDRRYDLFLVNAATGEEEPYSRPEQQDRAPRVIIEDGDIFYVTGEDKKQLTDTEAEENNPTLSPDGEKVAFTRDHDLYVLELSSGSEQRLTRDGSDVIYNGWASWVYMEEILGRSTQFKAYWWSPDSDNIAFMRFDDRPVGMFPIHSVDGSYGELIRQRYPKSGTDNPKVKLGVADLSADGAITWADFDPEKDQYFGMPYWRPDAGSLWIQWMNRDQDHLVIYEMDLSDGSKTQIYEERQESWISLDSGSRLQFLDNGNGFLMMSDKSGWMHIYHYDMSGKLVNRVTGGDWTVNGIELVNEENGWIYFTAEKENSARNDLYKVRMDGTGMQRLTFGPYTHRASLSPGGSYFVTTYGNVSTPDRITLADNEGNIIRELADSKGPEFENYNFARTEFMRVTVDGFDLPVTVTWPMELDKNGKHPLLLSIYGGPNSSSVSDRWPGLGMDQWWAREGLIQVTIDHRGSGHFGKKGQNYMHRDLGRWEIHDYSAVLRKLIEKYKFIDEDRIGITGFSYGGYVTCLALTKGSDLFDFGLAGGSVTDWHLYDTHYTERYMDRPQDNPEGYKSSSVMTYVDQYDGGLLIVHGSMDDNVHMQNSLQLVSALESAGKHFEFVPYLGGKHGWYNLPGKYRHYQDKRYLFYYKNLIGREAPKEVLNN